MPAQYLNLYVDNSNIFIEGQRLAGKKGENPPDLRIYFRNFMQLAVNGREIKEAVWGGSIPPANDNVWQYLRDRNIEPDLIPRSSSGENETIDHLIQLRMHRHARKYRTDPGIIVLATGDGKGYADEEGFLFDLEGFVSDGWGIELLSWDHSCHGRLQQFAEQHGRYIPLDTFYDKITFIKNGRIVQPITP